MLCELFITFTKVTHDDISSINQEIIKNKTNSGQNLGTSPVNNLTKDHIITDGVKERSQAPSFIDGKKEVNDMGKVLNKNRVIQNQNPKRARHDAKNPILNKQSISIAYWNVHCLKQDKANLIRSGWPA